MDAARNNPGKEQVLSGQKEDFTQDRSGTEEDVLNVKIKPIKTEGASQSTCHNPCM